MVETDMVIGQSPERDTADMCQGIFLGKIMALAPPVALIKMSLKVTTSPPPADSTPVGVSKYFFPSCGTYFTFEKSGPV